MSSAFVSSPIELTSATETRDVKRQLRVLEAAGETEVSLAEAEFKRAQAAVALSRA